MTAETPAGTRSYRSLVQLRYAGCHDKAQPSFCIRLQPELCVFIRGGAKGRVGRRVLRISNPKEGVNRPESKQKAVPQRVQQTRHCPATATCTLLCSRRTFVRHIRAGILAQASNAPSGLPRRELPVTSKESTPLTQQRHCTGFTPVSLLRAPFGTHPYTTLFTLWSYIFIINALSSAVKSNFPSIQTASAAIHPCLLFYRQR